MSSSTYEYNTNIDFDSIRPVTFEISKISDLTKKKHNLNIVEYTALQTGHVNDNLQGIHNTLKERLPKPKSIGNKIYIVWMLGLMILCILMFSISLVKYHVKYQIYRLDTNKLNYDIKDKAFTEALVFMGSSIMTSVFLTIAISS